jgi:hypothetical protein
MMSVCVEKVANRNDQEASQTWAATDGNTIRYVDWYVRLIPSRRHRHGCRPARIRMGSFPVLLSRGINYQSPHFLFFPVLLLCHLSPLLIRHAGFYLTVTVTLRCLCLPTSTMQ